MKRILVLVFCLVLCLLAFASCGDDETSGSSQSSNNTTASSNGGNSGGSNEDENKVVASSKYDYTMSEYITLPDYKKYVAVVEKDHLQQLIDTYIMQNATASRKTVCMQGDVVDVTYIGYRIDENGDILYENGKPVVFNEADSYGVYLGAGLSISEFETGIVGMQIGEIKEVYTTFPEDYFETSLAGETVLFEIILNYIYDAPAYDDDFVKSVFPEYANKVEFEASLKNTLVANLVQEYINENCTVISYPEKEYSEYVQKLEETAKNFEEQMQITLDEYLLMNYGMTRDEYIRSEMKKEMIYYALAQAQNVEITLKETNTEKQSLIDYYVDYYKNMGYSQSAAAEAAEEFVKDLGDDYIYENVLFGKLDEMLPKLVIVTEKAATRVSITQLLADKQNAQTGNELGDVCPSHNLIIFDENGTGETEIDPSRNLGRLTVIYFWGVWSEPAKNMLATVDAIAAEYADVLSVFAPHSVYQYGYASDYLMENFGDSQIIFLQDYLEDESKDYEQGWYFRKLGGTNMYPYTVVLDETGKIIFKQNDEISYDELKAIIDLALFDGEDDNQNQPDDSEDKVGNEIGDICPSYDMEIFDGNGMTGETVDPSKNTGKITVINFWGIWCGPCKSELPDFDAIATEYQDVLTIYAAHSSIEFSGASEYVSENFPNSKMIFLKDNLLDPDDEYSGDIYYTALGGSVYYPFTVILDKEGKIIYQHSGMLPYDELKSVIDGELSKDTEEEEKEENSGDREEVDGTVYIPDIGTISVEDLINSGVYGSIDELYSDTDGLNDEEIKIIKDYLDSINSDGTEEEIVPPTVGESGTPIIPF